MGFLTAARAEIGESVPPDLDDLVRATFCDGVPFGRVVNLVGLFDSVGCLDAEMGALRLAPPPGVEVLSAADMLKNVLREALGTHGWQRPLLQSRYARFTTSVLNMSDVLEVKHAAKG